MRVSLSQALKLGREAIKARDLSKAYRIFWTVIQSKPNNAEAAYALGRLSIDMRKTEEALPYFRIATQAAPDITEYWVSYINILIELNHFTEALSTLSESREKKVKGVDFKELEQRISDLISDFEDISFVRPTDTLISIAKEPPDDRLSHLISLCQKRNFKQALEDATSMLSYFPDSVNLFNISGAACEALGQLKEASENYQRAIKINPYSTEAHYNLANIQRRLRQFDDAIKSYRLAIKCNPNFYSAYINLAVTLMDIGAPTLAIRHYKKSLEINPDSALIFYNMGNSQMASDDLTGAARSYREAVRIQPTYPDAHNNLAIVLSELGDVGGAIESYLNAIQADPGYAEAYYSLGGILRNYSFTKSISDMEKTLIELLGDGGYCRPIDISEAVISFLKLRPVMKDSLGKNSSGQLEGVVQSVVSKLSEEKLFIKLMSVSPIPDLEVEALLTNLRSKVLFSISEISDSQETIRFQSALALQCFLNEYLYAQDGKEFEVLEALEAEVIESLRQGQQPSPRKILCLASYKPLHRCAWIESVTATPDLSGVLQRQVYEPKQERQLSEKIRIFKEINDAISLKVRQQYEQNPYPRWANTQTSIKSKSIDKVCRDYNLRVTDERIRNVEAPEILIAGCGTGQQSIGTASRFQDSKVLAVDLSLSSVAHALRKTKELNFDNIQYMQADILDLEKLDRKFDIVESTGVLHHMQEPMLGWHILMSRLKPGGLMRIGLYSELARQHIVKIRREISEFNVGSSEDAIKAFRATLIKSDEKHHRDIVESSDFFSLSSMRDLLFHVQEHRFTLLQIKSCLLELGLEFCGFEAPKILKAFQLSNKEKNDPYNLYKWNNFEESNPHTFGAMYQFWAQKMT